MTLKKHPNSYESGYLLSEIIVLGVSVLFFILLGLKILLIMIKTTLRIDAKVSKPIKLIKRQFW